MSKFGNLLFVLILFHIPYKCRPQPPSGASVIVATKDVLAKTVGIVKSAKIDAAIKLADIKKFQADIKTNGTLIERKLNTVINEALKTFQGRIDSLGVNTSDAVIVNDCAIPTSSSVESAAEEILMDAKSCVSKTIESTERELNDTYFSIESTLARINSEQNLAETCVVEYDKTEMALRNSIVTALCVTQAKERILSIIKDELSNRNNTTFLHVLYTDAIKKLKNCDDANRISSFITDTDFIYVKIMTCISN